MKRVRGYGRVGYAKQKARSHGKQKRAEHARENEKRQAFIAEFMRKPR